MNPFHSLAEYEAYIYTLPQRFPRIQRSTLVVVRRGDAVAAIQGEIEFPQGIRLIVREKVSFSRSLGVIEGYGYEVWQDRTLLYWYDSQPHPHIPELQTNHPHHKHIPPDIKHNRIPAPGLSFEQPNLLFLIEEIEHTLLNQE
jgi:hypothetical protein